MSNINKELEKILAARYGKDVRQSIHDAIKEIDAVADTAQDSATQMAAMAGNHEASAKASMESALASAESARISAEQAMSGTPEGYEALVEQVGLLDIAKSTGNTLYNSKKGGYRLNDLVGNTEQKTLSGKNLLDVPDAIEPLNGVTFKVNADKSITCTGTPTQTTPIYLLGSYSNPIAFPPGDYILSGSVSKNWYIRIRIYNADGTSKESNVSDGQFTINDGELMSVLIYLIHDAGDLGTITFYPMIRKADITDDTYEPYCGGTPSPNPLFPQAIENTFDVVEMEQGAIMTGDGTNTSHNARVRSIRPIPCKSGDMIKIVTEKQFSLCNILYYNENGYIGYDYAQNMNVIEKTAKENATYFRFVIGSNTSITPETAGKITLTVNGKYVGQIVEREKNFLEYNRPSNTTKNGVTITYNSDGSITLNGTCTSWFFVTLTNMTLPIGKYVVSGYGTGAPFAVYVGEERVVYTPLDKVNFEVTDATSNIQVRYECSNNAVFNNMTLYPMIRRADVEDDTYEPYTEKVTTFFLNEPLRATDRVVKVDGVWYEEHNMRECLVELTKIYTASNGNVYSNFAPTNKRQMSGKVGESFCDRATYKQNNVANGYFYENTPNFVFGGTADDTLETMQAKYNGAILQYRLAEPTLTPLDTESQLALNSLETFDTVTYIEVDSKVKPTSISGEYGTSQVGAYTLQALNKTDSNAIKIEDAINTMLLITP